MKRILINATQKEELRFAIVINKDLIDLDIEITSLYQKKGNIYKGNVVRIEPSLEAAFIDYGGNRHGFLPFKEVSKSYYQTSGETSGRVSIENAIHEGQQVLVQIEREERDNKGAALTTFISLAGRYLVMMPNNPYGGGISRRVTDKDRSELRKLLSQLSVKNEESIIIRTAGLGHSIKELNWDMENLRTQWSNIITAAKSKPAPFLVYQENNILIRALRDQFDESFDEIIIDNQGVFQDAKSFLEKMMPQHVNKLKLYEEATPLFSTYQIEDQIETAYEREVRLPSGGIIAFDQTEALLSIDINSSKATKGRNIEATALATNLEACREIARQLRIRDAGGLIVIDFIDMQSYNNQRSVENELNTALEPDRARIQTGKISRFGLLEMSRQHLRPSLGDVSHITCPRCKGSGKIRNIESCALAALRMIEDEANKRKTKQVVAYLPITVTSFLLNEKRVNITEIESQYQITVIIIPDINLETPHFRVTHHRVDDKETQDKSSYSFIQSRDPAHATMMSRRHQTSEKAEKPMLGFILPSKAAPTGSWLKKLGQLFNGKKATAETDSPTKKQSRQQSSRPQRRERGRTNNPQRTRQARPRRGNGGQQRRPSERSPRPSERPPSPKPSERSPRQSQRNNHSPQTSRQTSEERGNRRQQHGNSQNRQTTRNNDRSSTPVPPVSQNAPKIIPEKEQVPAADKSAIPVLKEPTIKPDFDQRNPASGKPEVEKRPPPMPPPSLKFNKPSGMTQVETKNKE